MLKFRGNVDTSKKESASGRSTWRFPVYTNNKNKNNTLLMHSRRNNTNVQNERKLLLMSSHSKSKKVRKSVRFCDG